MPIVVHDWSKISQPESIQVAPSIIKELLGKGYLLDKNGYLYPPLTELPLDYPWSPSNIRGPVTDEDFKNRNKLTSHPLPVGYFDNSQLNLVNGEIPAIKSYHRQIKELIYNYSQN